MRDDTSRLPVSGTAQPGSPPPGRHGRMFDILCHAERAQRTSARPTGALDEETGAALRDRALASLKAPSGLSRGRGLQALLSRLQKKTAAATPTVIAPMTVPEPGSVTAKDT